MTSTTASSSSAATQFATWSREEDSWRSATAAADRRRVALLAFSSNTTTTTTTTTTTNGTDDPTGGAVSRLRWEHQTWVRRGQAASDALGQLHQEHALWHTQERARLTQRWTADRAALEAAGRQWHDGTAHDTAAHQAHARDMRDWTEALADVLAATQEAHQFRAMLTENTVTALRDSFQPNQTTSTTPTAAVAKGVGDLQPHEAAAANNTNTNTNTNTNSMILIAAANDWLDTMSDFGRAWKECEAILPTNANINVNSSSTTTTSTMTPSIATTETENTNTVFQEMDDETNRGDLPMSAQLFYGLLPTPSSQEGDDESTTTTTTMMME